MKHQPVTFTISEAEEHLLGIRFLQWRWQQQHRGNKNKQQLLAQAEKNCKQWQYNYRRLQEETITTRGKN
jgi:hypothetical protein